MVKDEDKEEKEAHKHSHLCTSCSSSDLLHPPPPPPKSFANHFISSRLWEINGAHKRLLFFISFSPVGEWNLLGIVSSLVSLDTQVSMSVVHTEDCDGGMD